MENPNCIKNLIVEKLRVEKMQIIKAEWLKSYEKMLKTPAFQKIVDGTITRKEYASILRQIFHQVREHPQALAALTMKFNGEQREMVGLMLRHAISEHNHDQAALKDIASLGFETDRIPTERPLPMTQATIGFMRDLIQNQNPVAFLGYLFHLEFTPTQGGKMFLDGLLKAGIPESAMSFIQEHAQVDIGHNRLMEKYVEVLVRTPEDLEAIIYSVRASANLYGMMLSEAVESAEATADYGLSSEEARIPSLCARRKAQ